MWRDGFRYRGRGYVQITGRANYKTWSKKLNLDLESNPDLVSMNPDVAAQILVRGMRDGSFRGKHKLSKFITGSKKDFFNARDIINGDKNITDEGQTKTRGQRIAEIAENYLAVLTI